MTSTGKNLAHRQRALENLVKDWVEVYDPTAPREGIAETPKRVVAAWQEYCAGYRIEAADVLKTFGDGSEHYDQMVFVGAIPFYSLCEHHLAPFFGIGHIGYIPGDRVVGLSKLPRLLDVYARRLQVQERITTQVCRAIDDHLRTRGTGVVLQARHLCMESRGINKPGTITTTSALSGHMKNEDSCKAEFLAFVRDSKQGSVL